MTTFFVAPNGTYPGMAWTQPCSLGAYVRVARPGDTAQLLPGVYTGKQNLLSDTEGLELHGRDGQPITFQALVPGEVTLDADFSSYAIWLRDCSHLTFEDLDFRHGDPGTVRLERSPHVTFRRCCAYENAPSSNAIWCIAYDSRYVLLDQCAGWGWGRKTFEIARASDVEIRDCYGVWNGCKHRGPKGTVMNYGSRRLTITRGLFEWYALMPEDYNLLDDKEAVVRRMTNHEIDQPYGIIGVDEAPDGGWADFVIDGSTVFTRREARCDALIGAIGFGEIDGVTVRHCVAAINHPHINPSCIQKFNDGRLLVGTRSIRCAWLGGRRVGNPLRVAGSEQRQGNTDVPRKDGSVVATVELYLPPGMRERIVGAGGADVPNEIEVR